MGCSGWVSDEARAEGARCRYRRAQDFDIGVVKTLDIFHVVYGLAAAAKAVSRPFVVGRLGEQAHGPFHIAEPAVGIPSLFPRQAAGVEQMAVADIVRSQREANPHVPSATWDRTC